MAPPLPPPPPPLPRILEINLISAEDLAAVSRTMKTYAIVWVQPHKKHVTGVDQTGGTKPIWNDKFRFHLDDKILNSDEASMVVEIYAAAWVKDVLIGWVKVHIKDIFLLQSVADDSIKTSDTRTVILQIRRPSGRPQGILNMEVSVLDANEYSKESSITNHNPEITREYNFEKIADMESGDYSEITDNGESGCNSDVGPSASIVAAAIAKGLYKPLIDHEPKIQTNEAKKLREWTMKERRESRERWPSENVAGEYRERKQSGCIIDGGKLFSCFGNAFGCEISITCGGNKKNKPKNGNNNKIFHLSSVGC